SVFNARSLRDSLPICQFSTSIGFASYRAGSAERPLAVGKRERNPCTASAGPGCAGVGTSFYGRRQRYGQCLERPQWAFLADGGRDRKSTRLNSSHVKS